MVCGVLNISVAGDLATSLGTRVSLDRKITPELPRGCRSVGSNPGSEHLPVLQQCEALWLFNALCRILFLSSRKTRNTYMTINLYSEVLSAPTLSRMQWTALRLSVHLCIWWCNSKFILKGDTHELNKSTAQDENTLKVTVSSIQSTWHKPQVLQASYTPTTWVTTGRVLACAVGEEVG